MDVTKEQATKLFNSIKGLYGVEKPQDIVDMHDSGKYQISPYIYTVMCVLSKEE